MKRLVPVVLLALSHICYCQNLHNNDVDLAQLKIYNIYILLEYELKWPLDSIRNHQQLIIDELNESLDLIKDNQYSEGTAIENLIIAIDIISHNPEISPTNLDRYSIEEQYEMLIFSARFHLKLYQVYSNSRYYFQK